MTTVAALPEVVSLPDHRLLIEVPDGNVNAVVHPFIAEDPAVTFTSAWNPSGQLLTTVSTAVHAPAVTPDVLNVRELEAVEVFPAASRATTFTV